MLEKLKDKYVFFDIDGTLSEYRYNDKLYASSNNEIGAQSLYDLLFNNLYCQARPLKTMQNIISKLDSDKIFVLGACVVNNEAIQKYKWLEEYYPNFRKDHVIFVNSTLLKPDVIVEYAKHYNIPVSETVLVEDRLDALRKAEEMGITSYHISSFIE